MLAEIFFASGLNFRAGFVAGGFYFVVDALRFPCGFRGLAGTEASGAPKGSLGNGRHPDGLVGSWMPRKALRVPGIGTPAAL